MSKVIQQSGKDVQSWVIPNVGESEDLSSSSVLTAKQVEELQQQAYDEAYREGLEKGRQEGFANVLEKVQLQLNEFDGLLNSLEKPFEQLDSQVDQELTSLVIALVKQMVRREIKTEPGQIMAVIRDAIESLPVATSQLQLRLHPEDATLVEEFYKLSEKDHSWDIIEDPLITRGGCKVITTVTQVDATLETRLNQLFAQVFGERQQDSEA